MRSAPPPPRPLSGGEKRRVSIAAQVANLMRDLQESLRLTYLFISHDLRMVELVARLVMVMYIGQVVEMAPARTLAAGAAHPYSRLLWSAVDPYTGRRIERTAAPLRWEIAACRDKETEPRLTEVSSGHLVACHLPQGR